MFLLLKRLSAIDDSRGVDAYTSLLLPLHPLLATITFPPVISNCSRPRYKDLLSSHSHLFACTEYHARRKRLLLPKRLSASWIQLH